ncbi:hypothetical protein B0H16DRAFT_1829944 [Mycena metata]|uniref:Uncharacterized protein n=1 Tax=Mycena metata TaxID=1033252 RepID=A0AAD7K8Z3_9AGAR|nr:hypothetical protein B0H16DRAFT_1829944 [Mycena metata]
MLSRQRHPKIPNEIPKEIPPHRISSLNPVKLRSSDYIDASGLAPLAIAFGPTQNPAQLWYSLSKKSETQPFPPTSKGFLYFYQDLHTLVESGIRLRLTSSNSPSFLASGEDLIAPSGAPWHIPLPALAVDRKHARIVNQLLRENMVTQDDLSHYRTLFGKRWQQWAPQLLTRITQEFPVDFSRVLTTTVVTGEALYRLKLPHIFGLKEQGPWNGSAIVRFEASTLPKYAGSRVIHLRILRIVNPVTPNATGPQTTRIVKPEAGALLAFYRPSSPILAADADVPADVKPDADAELELEPEPWTYNIDRQTINAQALRALWDSEETRSRNTDPSSVVHPL